jgi:hypothetical protein
MFRRRFVLTRFEYRPCFVTARHRPPNALDSFRTRRYNQPPWKTRRSPIQGILRVTLMPPVFLRLNFATVWVRDHERSRRFFVEQLGFRVAVDEEVPGSGRWIIATRPPACPASRWLLHSIGKRR